MKDDDVVGLNVFEKSSGITSSHNFPSDRLGRLKPPE